MLLATVSWVTDADGFWDVATNWLDDVGLSRVPGLDDDVVIDRGAANPVITLRSGAQSIKSLQAREELSITGGSLTIAADSEISDEFTLGAGMLTANGSLALGGASTWSGGTLSGTGTTTNNGTLAINPAGSAAFASGTLANAGVINVTGQLQIAGAATLNNLAGAVLDIQGSSSTIILGSPGTGTINNSGMLQKSIAGGTATLTTLNFNNLPGGIVASQADELVFSSGMLTNWQGGDFQVAATAGVTFAAGTHTLAGTLTGSGAGKVKLTGSTLQIAAAGATFNFPAGLADWNGATMTGGTLTNVGALTINPTVQHFLNNGAIANAGVVTHTSGQLNLNGGTITNLPGGVWEVQHATAVLSGFSPGFGVFDNRGTFLKTTNAGTASTPAVSFDNRAEGSIVVNAGTLTLSGGGRNQGGALHVEPGTVLNFVVAGSNHVLAGNFTGTGGGKVRITGGTALVGAAGATFDFDPGVLEWTGGTISGFAPLVNVGSMLINGVVTINDGTINNGGIITQIGTPFTSNIQMTRGGLAGGIGPAFNNLAGGLYDMQMAAGTFGITGFAQGQVEVNNFGTIRKSSAGYAGFSSVRLNNVALIEVLDGSFELAEPTHFGVSSILQFQNGQPITTTPAPLTGGTWHAVGNGNIIFPANITANAGTIILEGNGDNPRLSALAANSGTISLLGGKDFTRTGDFTNTGELVLGPESTLTVNGALTLAATSEIEFRIGGTPASGLFGNIMALGATTLDGAADLALVNGFDPQAGQAFQLMTFASRTGDFASFDDGAAGRTVVFSSATTALNFTVNVLADGADLDVDAITVPASGLSGQSITIDYTVNNDSAFATPAGPWTDSLYLSRDGAYDTSDGLLGRVTHSGAVAGNTGYNGQLVAPLPGVPPGNYRVLVIADSRGLVPDTDRDNNTLASTGVIAVDIPALTPGAAFNGTIASGQDFFFRVDLPGGQTPSFTLNTGATGGAELYLRQLDVPDRATFDVSAFNPASASLRVFDQGAAATTHFILVHGRENAGAGTAFTLTAEALGFGPVSTEHNTGAPLGRVTTTVHGSLFTPQTTFSLVTPGTGALVPAVQTVFQDAGTVFVTFDLAGLPLGNYGVRANDGAAQSTLSAGFTVVNGTAGTLDFHLTTPRFIRPPFRGAVVTLEYENTGDTDLVAPVIVLVGDTAKMRLPESETFSTGSIELLAVNPNGPAGILTPGARGSLEVIFEPLTVQSRQQTNFEAFVVGDGVTFDWEDLRDGLQPKGFADDAWDAVYDVFKTQAGTTSGQFNALLAENATHLALLGQGTADVGRLLAFELEQADDFGAIAARYELGAMGRGRTAPFDVKAVSDAAGNVTIQLGDEVRAYAALPFGEFRTIAADGSILTRLGNGALELAEASGARTVFRVSDGDFDFLEDTRGNRVTAAYDGAGRLDTLTETNGDVTDFSYNAAGFISQITDAVGRAVTFTYDAGGHLTSRTDPLGTTGFTYSAQHALTQITLPDGSHTNFTYDARGRLATQSRDGGAELQTFAYDSTGRVTITDGVFNQTSLFRGVGGQVLKTVDALGRVTSVEADRFGLIQRVTGPDGATVDIEHNEIGRPTKLTDALGRITAFDLDDNGQLLGLTNANGNATQFGFNATSDLTSVTDAGGGTATFGYDARGNRTAVVNERGQLITFTYDAKDLISRKDLPDGTHVDFLYDTHRNLTSASERSAANADLGTTSFEYDGSDRLTKVTYPNGKFLTFTYDAASRRLTATDQDGFTIRYAYDALGRLDTLRDTVNALIVDYDFDPLGRLALETRGNGATTDYSYDALNRVARIEHHASAGGASIETFNYTYDAAGRVASVADSHGTTTYGYDFTGQLENVALPGGRTLSYAYDANGNRTLATDNGAPTAYAVNLLDQYTSAGAATFAYDGDGHLITRADAAGTTSYTWDANGQLTGVVSPGGTFSYGYDALGTRIAVVENGTRTDLLVDPAGFGNVFAEYEGGTLTAHNAHGIGLAARIAGGGASSFYHYDITGNTAALSGAAGATLNTYQYLPFGEIAATTGTAENAFTFNGRFGIEDRGDGLFFMRNRSYDAATGRFISSDPIGFLGGDANTYRFVANNPVGSADPSGLVVVDVLGVLYLVEAGFPTVALATDAVVAADVVVTGVTGVGTVVEGAGISATLLTTAEEIAVAETAVASAAGGVSTALAATGIGLIAVSAAVVATASYDYQTISLQFNLNPDLEGQGQPLTDNSGMHDSTYNNFVRKNMEDPEVGALAKTILRTTTTTPEQAILDARQALRNFKAAEARGDSTTVTSTDPNNIIGPAGFNADVVVDAPAPGQVRFDGFVGTGAPYNYTIQFENKPSASAPAQVVKVTHTLDGDLDLSTFRFQNVGWGDFKVDAPAGGIGSSFHTVVDATAALGVLVQVDADLNLATGLLEVTFTSLDATTGDLPLDPFAGFLPPNVIAPIGDGFINFNVRSKPGRADGTRIDALATVVFDTEPPLDTPAVHNTIDAVAPSSSVNPLPVTTFSATKKFTVSWSGTDDTSGPAGSGVAFFDVFASDNGGPFTLFTGGAPDTSATFAGEFGHTYSFFSVATDNVGNVQPTAGAAQATTTLADPGPGVQALTAETTTKGISRFVLTFDQTLDATSAANLANYSLRFAGKDKRFGSGDDKLIALGSLVFVQADRTVKLSPASSKPIKFGQFVQVTATSASLANPGGLMNSSGIALDGNADGQPGGDFAGTIGVGTKLNYNDANNDLVSLALTRGGLMELTTLPGSDPRLRLTGTIAGASTLSGSVKKPKTGGGDGRTSLAAITGSAGVLRTGLALCTPAVTSNCFNVGSLSAVLVDRVLESALR